MSLKIPQETFASLLRVYRQEHNITQSELAESAGYDRSYLSYLERGLRNPTREVVLTLARVLDLPDSERDRLLLSAQFAAESPGASATIDLSDRVVELVARSISDLPEPSRSAFRAELAGFLSYLRLRYQLASPEEVLFATER
jgi:transcriptional regulator with XRE-family HTH domain